MANTLNTLTAEFTALPARDKAAILRALTAAEREQFVAILESELSGEQLPTAGDDHVLDANSPWLTKRIREALARESPTTRMTNATRQLLIELSSRPHPAEPETSVSVIGQGQRSLGQAAAGILAKAWR